MAQGIKGFVWVPPATPAPAPPGASPANPVVVTNTVAPVVVTRAHGLPIAVARRIHNTLMRPPDQKDALPRANQGPRVVNPYLLKPADALATTPPNPYKDPFPTAADVADPGPKSLEDRNRKIPTDPTFVPPINPHTPATVSGIGSTGPRRGVRGQVTGNQTQAQQQAAAKLVRKVIRGN